jgi:hypothetical protein
MNTRAHSELIEEHRAEIRRLEAEAATEPGASEWPPSGFYLTWHLMVGMVLGALGAAVSLGANLVGAPLFGRQPFDLIRIYLTFPMGGRALDLADAPVLAIGCVLYLVTGAVLGILFHLVLAVYFKDASSGRRFAIATVMGLALWIVNFYLILSWLQPVLLGGNWIVSMVPWWVGLLTHLAFAWTMAVGENWGQFERLRNES